MKPMSYENSEPGWSSSTEAASSSPSSDCFVRVAIHLHGGKVSDLIETKCHCDVFFFAVGPPDVVVSSCIYRMT